MVRLTRKHLGKGARCSVLVKLLHPSREVAEALPNTTDQQWLDDLITTRLDRTYCHGNNFESVFFTSATIPGIILSCARRNCIIREEGHPNALWDVSARTVRVGARRANAVPVAEVIKEQVKIGKDIFRAGNWAEDILQTFGGRDSRWTMTTIQRQRTSLPSGTIPPLSTTFTKVNRGVGMA